MIITNKLIPVNRYNRPGTKHTPIKIGIHWTGNPGSPAANGAAYQMNVAKGLFPNQPDAWTSSQYVLGWEGEIIHCVPDDEMSYAASGNNAGVIHIEVCIQDSSGRFSDKAIAALGELVRELMSKYKISAENVVRHYDLTGKLCPPYYVDAARWAELRASITSAPKASTLYRVQIGAFSSRENAENYAAEARKKGFQAFVTEVDTNG